MRQGHSFTVIQMILTPVDRRFEDMNRALAAHSIKPVVDSVYSFDETVAAYKRLASQQHVGKVVIRVASN